MLNKIMDNIPFYEFVIEIQLYFNKLYVWYGSVGTLLDCEYGEPNFVTGFAATLP